jgi:hypothetical protein
MLTTSQAQKEKCVCVCVCAGGGGAPLLLWSQMLLLPIVLLLPSKTPVDLDGKQFHSETKKISKIYKISKN